MELCRKRAIIKRKTADENNVSILPCMPKEILFVGEPLLPNGGQSDKTKVEKLANLALQIFDQVVDLL